MLNICDVYLTQRESVNLKKDLVQSPEKSYILNWETLFQLEILDYKSQHIKSKILKNTSCNFPQRQLRFTDVSPKDFSPQTTKFEEANNPRYAEMLLEIAYNPDEDICRH